MLFARCDICDKVEIEGKPEDFEEFAHGVLLDVADYPGNYDPDDPDQETIEPVVIFVQLRISSTSQGEGKSFEHICTKCAVKHIKKVAQDLKD